MQMVAVMLLWHVIVDVWRGGWVEGRRRVRSGAGERWNARVLTRVRVGGMVGGRHLYMQHLAVVIWKSEPDPNAGKKG